MTKPSLGQGVLCVLVISGLQAGLNWMDAASNTELSWVALAVVVFWIGVLWLRRRR